MPDTLCASKKEIMSYYISRFPPKFDNWQFKELQQGISPEEWSQIVEKFDNLNISDRGYILESTQNKDFSIRLFHNSTQGFALTFSNFPERYRGEIVKYLHQICQILSANIYSLNNDGHTADKFDFDKYSEDIAREYKPIDEKQYTKLEVNELIGLLTISSSSKEKIVEKLNLIFDNVDTLENSIQSCYDSNSIVIRQIQEWIVVIGKPENLFNANSASEQNELLIDLMNDLSSDFGKVGYHFNASKYSYFENYQFHDGKLTYKYIHGDGEEEIIGEKSKEFFEDFLALTFDKSIKEGVETYKIASR